MQVYGVNFYNQVVQLNFKAAINETYLILSDVDPIAKACVPSGIEILVESKDYGPVFSDPNLFMYNAFYRSQNIYKSARMISDKIKGAFDHFYEIEQINGDTGSVEIVKKLVTYSLLQEKVKGIGTACGQQFKNFCSISRQPLDIIVPEIGLSDQKTFVYPEYLLDVQYPEFDELLFPTVNQTEYPAYLII